MENKIKVIALDTYTKRKIKDNELGYKPEEGTEFEVSEERLKVLLGENKYKLVFVKIKEEINPDALNEADIKQDEEETDLEGEEKINESEIGSLELTDKVPEDEELKEGITVVPDLEEKTVEELKNIAEEKGIELKTSMKKADIIEEIRKAVGIKE